jgi:putative PIN family toxin of toxin-antitoxin system
MIRAVLDANVFVSAAIKPEGPAGRLIELLLRESSFELITTPAIIEETRRALSYPRVRAYIQDPAAALEWLDDLLLFADIVEDRDRGPCIPVDPDDDKYLHAAVAGLASAVISGDHHLLDVGEFEGIRIITPKAFLGLLGH